MTVWVGVRGGVEVSRVAPHQAVIALARAVEEPRRGDIVDARSDREVDWSPCLG